MSINGKLRRKPQNRPLTAIDRFLWGGDNHSSSHHRSNVERNRQHPCFVDEEGENNCPPFSYQDELGVQFLPLLSFEEPSTVDAPSFLEQDGAIGENDENFRQASEKDCRKGSAVGNFNKNSAGATGKRVKRGCSRALIKGQWTDEEDR